MTPLPEPPYTVEHTNLIPDSEPPAKVKRRSTIFRHEDPTPPLFLQGNLADRHSSGKPKLSYVSTAPAALRGLADVFEFGAETKGYGKHNWKKGLVFSALVDSLDRHKLAFLNGEDEDNESGLPHVDHLLWNALILSEMYHTRLDLDDRYKPTTGTGS